MDFLQVPDGPADKHLEQGDMLIRINGEVSMLLFFIVFHSPKLSLYWSIVLGNNHFI